MHIKRLCLLLLTSTCLHAGAQAQLPADVARFIEKRDGCDHFRGEEPYDAERRAFLLKNMNKLCKDTDRQLARLKKKYTQQPAIMEKLNDYDEQIEGGRGSP